MFLSNFGKNDLHKLSKKIIVVLIDALDKNVNVKNYSYIWKLF